MNAGLQPLPLAAPRNAVDVLNSACFCFSLDGQALARALDTELGQPGLSAMVLQRWLLDATRPTLTHIQGSKPWLLALLEWWLQVHVDGMARPAAAAGV